MGKVFGAGLAFGLALVSGGAFAAETFLAEKEDVFVRTRDCREWKLPAMDTAKGRVVVEFNARIDYPRVAGWCPCWQILVNGHILMAAATRNETRLLNKPFSWKHKWFGRYDADTRADKWYALYQPDFTVGNAHFEPEWPEATHYVIDVSDVVRADGENTLRFNASSLSKEFYVSNHVTDREPAVVFHGLSVRQEDTATRLPKLVEKTIRAEMKAPKAAAWAFGGDDGKAVLRLNGATWPIESVFSVPGGGEVSLGAKKTLDTPFYTLTRRFVKRDDRVDVYDTFLSKTNELIGVKVRYETPTADFASVYVAGDCNPSSISFEGGRNPSVVGICEKNGCAVGLLAQDDVFRVQNVQYCENGTMGIRTDGLALLPGEPRTVEWSVYPVGEADYFAFVNAVRRDWDVNFPIVGCFNLSMNCFYRGTQQGMSRSMDNMGLGINTFGVHIWSHLGGKYKEYHDDIWGLGMNARKVRVRLDAERVIEEDPSVVHAFERACIANCRKWTPHVKILTYLHNQISVDADDDKYEDARMVNRAGKRMNYNGGLSEKVFLPTESNACGRDFLKLIDWYLDGFDLDGIYLDEINHCNSRIYYGDNPDLWDRATVELDEKGNVKRKLSFVALRKLKFTLQCFDKIINKRGKVMIGNFSPETRSERAFKFPRFEETYSHRWVALSHLYTPVQLGDMLTYKNTPSDMAADQRMALMRGALYYHYLGSTGCPSLTSKMFPFTPVELHAGWLVGKERILTCVSGEFGWRGEKPDADVFVFDELGREVPGYPVETAETPLGRMFRLELKKDHCAAIVRR